MTLQGVANVVAIVVALGASMVAVARADRHTVHAPSSKGEAGAGQNLHFTTTATGERALLDATGTAVPLRKYRRIVSGSTIADALLISLSERDRIAAFTSYGAAHSKAPAYSERPSQPGLQNMEGLLSLKPDLVITNHIGDPRQLGRLREQGLTVFDLGEMRGVSTLVPDILAIGELVGHRELGRDYARTWKRRLDRVAAALPPAERRSAMYIGIYGTALSGGATGTSYHDVLTFAGLRDAAAPRYHDWPDLTSEQVLELDPDVIVSGNGGRQKLCSYPGLDRLRACDGRGKVIELANDLVGDPGPGMLEAAEQLHDAVYEPSR